MDSNKKFMISKNINKNIISEDELLAVTNRLSANMNNKFFFNSEPFKVHKGINIYENYEGRNLRQSYFQDCTFNNSNLSKTGLAGSIFINCKFLPCLLTDTNLQSCDFRNCKFESVKFEYTRMNKSSFHNTSFIDCVFSSTSINDAFFDGCQFVNCRWTISIENTVFKDTILDNVKIRSMNFEFVTFENIKSINVKYPFPTIPFIYNGLKYIYTTSDDIRITSAQKREGLTKDEYLSYINDLEKFYSATQNFFPLTNIYIAQEKFDDALEAIICGIKIAIQIRAFRMIKYYCKQIKYINELSLHQRQNLYRFILHEISLCDLKEFEKRALNQYLPEVKELLYIDKQKERIQILIETNIDENEIEKLTALMSVLDKFLIDKCTYSIEASHNSPFQILLNILTNPQYIGLIISGFSLIASITFGCISAVQSHNKKVDKKEKKQCEQYKKDLASRNINITNVYIISNGNIYINDQISSHSDIYLNK